MVVFTCGECGEAMKKAQVEGHFNRRCRNCNVVSCLDCGKDFWGKDYDQHTKCITEEEKYSGKNYVAKPNANKGEVKQQQWIQEVQNAIEKCKTNPKLREILERMKDFSNIPRKKAKFENFMKNSVRVYDKHLASQVWDLLMTNTDKPQKAEQAPAQNGYSKADNSSNQASTNNDRLETADQPQTEGEEPAKKLSKREKKEERSKKANKNEKKDKKVNGSENGVVTEVRKKSKKRKKNQDSEEEEEEDMKEEEEMKTDKKRKRQESDEDKNDDEEETAEPQRKVLKTKFNWNEVIVEVLKSKGEMKLKKLKRKVLSEYQAQGCTTKSEEKLWAKFDHKLKKNPVVKVLHDRAKLIE